MATATGHAGQMRVSVWHVPRTRGATSGALLVLLGIWGGLIPFVGPHFGYAYTPNATWTWTAGRLWLEVLPAAAAIIGGFVLATSANRAIGLWASWLAAVSGTWFIVGPSLSQLWGGGTPQTGTPTATTTLGATVEAIGFFYGLGAVILFLAAAALGRFSVVGVRDTRPVAADTPAATAPPMAAPATTAADQPTTAMPTERRPEDPEAGG
ncbi:MAG TPA: hypothetical protein VG317_17385 [Pseudonocardiaceae bacterium]|jgi:hypothetical protein|nr:hypothetical protein [Pseudonocardiaceae bacterium]